MNIYSIDDEDYRYECLNELLDGLAYAPEVGDVYYEATCLEIMPVNVFDDDLIQSFLFDADGLIYDQVGETYQDAYGNVSAQAKEELKKLMQDWAVKHVNLQGYYKITNTVKKTFTEEDLMP